MQSIIPEMFLGQRPYHLSHGAQPELLWHPGRAQEAVVEVVRAQRVGHLAAVQFEQRGHLQIFRKKYFIY